MKKINHNDHVCFFAQQKRYGLFNVLLERKCVQLNINSQRGLASHTVIMHPIMRQSAHCITCCLSLNGVIIRGNHEFIISSYLN